MKTTFHPKNYRKNNTPATIQKIGDNMLLIGAIGGAILLAPITLPATVLTVAGYMATIGGIGKVISKFFGTSVNIEE
jgi:hypothetical protein